VSAPHSLSISKITPHSIIALWLSCELKKKEEENVITGRERDVRKAQAEAIYEIRAGCNLITEGKLKLYSQPGLLKATTGTSLCLCFIITAKSANIYNK
jgi:hypothetical protein